LNPIEEAAREATRDCLDWLESGTDPFTQGERDKCYEIILEHFKRGIQWPFESQQAATQIPKPDQ
jgi:hypothetical protein